MTLIRVPQFLKKVLKKIKKINSFLEESFKITSVIYFKNVLEYVYSRIFHQIRKLSTLLLLKEKKGCVKYAVFTVSYGILYSICYS